MLSWIGGWSPERCTYALGQAKNIGFDLMEISLPTSLELDPIWLKKAFRDHGLEVRFTLILPKDCHLPCYPKKATSLLKRAVDLVARTEGWFLGGVLYSAIGIFTGSPCTPTEWELVREVFAEVAEYAGSRGVILGLEPVNRYESYIITSYKEVLRLRDELQLDNLCLMLDTFHMNIEEHGFYNAVVEAGNRLKYIHVTGSDRGMPGEDNVHWDHLFKGLAESKYTGDMVLENFSSQIAELIPMTSLWRKSCYDTHSLASGSLEFMRKKADQWGLR